MSTREPRIGLVLGGGGIAGYAFNSGVLTALAATTGFDPRTAEIVVGTSAGAIGAAVLRGGVPVATMSDRLLAIDGEPAELETL
ncbi:MAG: patatin-like phospholipase family protein, partial [Acidimicrobiales bacterium]